MYFSHLVKLNIKLYKVCNIKNKKNRIYLWILIAVIVKIIIKTSETSPRGWSSENLQMKQSVNSSKNGFFNMSFFP